MQRGAERVVGPPEDSFGLAVAFQVRRDTHAPPERLNVVLPRSGFSMIELLLTILIVVILAALLWGSNNTTQQQALKRACQKNLLKIYIGLEGFANENKGAFPATNGVRTSGEALDALVPRYTSDTASFICPASKDSALPAAGSLRNRKVSYAYYMGRSITNPGVLMSDQQLDTLAKATGEAAFSPDGKPPGNNHGKAGGNLLFCDGHTDTSPAHLRFGLALTAGEVLLNP
jgi:prepilin-type N-terminal cleavage/methylation domain-containing protein/prepilin-type processing-associated H-X9-DG protein